MPVLDDIHVETVDGKLVITMNQETAMKIAESMDCIDVYDDEGRDLVRLVGNIQIELEWQNMGYFGVQSDEGAE